MASQGVSYTNSIAIILNSAISYYKIYYIKNCMITKNEPHERLLQLELLLQWEGLLNNTRLRELFGLSFVRASQWIREFRDQCPHCMRWDSKTRSHHATAALYKHDRGDKRRLEDGESLARYLALVGLPHAGPIIWNAFPDFSAPNPRIFAVLGEAARNQRAVEIIYRSMREPAPHKRIISPHSVIRAGRRWHVRAFCSTNQAFRDYALGWVVGAKLLEDPAERLEQDDKAWTTRVPVRLMAHPDLTPDQESLIRFEYFNDTARRIETCRSPLVTYFIQDVRAAIDIRTQRPPDYQLAVENVDEVAPWLFRS